MRAELPTGTVTFLFTDIAGSTRLLHALGPAAYGRRSLSLDEQAPDFVAGVEEGRTLDPWDAAAIALGEEDEGQTVP